jgi:hypothetical protein
MVRIKAPPEAGGDLTAFLSGKKLSITAVNGRTSIQHDTDF